MFLRSHNRRKGAAAQGQRLLPALHHRSNTLSFQRQTVIRWVIRIDSLKLLSLPGLGFTLIVLLGLRQVHFVERSRRGCFQAGHGVIKLGMTSIANAATSIFHPASAPDFVPVPLLRDLQFKRLRDVVGRAWERVEWFRFRMQERGLSPDDIRSIDDIAKLPFTVKTDLRDTYPFGLFASPMEEVVRLHASSGTTGKPIVVAYTQEDLDVWTSVMVRSFAGCGLHDGDIVQNAYGYGLFTGGLGAHYGAEALGATVIPISGGNTDRQIMVMKDFGVTAICCTPSYFLHLIERAGELGVDLASSAAARRRLRRRAVDRIDAQAHRELSRHQGVRHLRPFRDHRAGRRHRMPVPGRSAHLRRSLLPGDHRSGDRQTCCPTAKRANWC